MLGHQLMSLKTCHEGHASLQTKCQHSVTIPLINGENGMLTNTGTFEVHLNSNG